MLSAEDQPAWLAYLLEMTDDGERQAAFSAQPRFHNPDLLPLIHAELIRCLYSDRTRARRAGALAEMAAQAVPDETSRAIGQRCQGNLLYADAHYAAAVDCYRESIRLFESAGREAEAGRVYFGGLQALIYLGRYQEAHAWAGEARVRFEQAHDELRLARLELNIGNLYYRQDLYQQAMEHYALARQRLATSDQPQDYAAVLSNSAVCLSSMGRFAEALAEYQEAQAWCRANGLGLLAAAADYNVAYLHFLRGEYRRASQLYKLSRVHSNEVGDEYHAALCDLDESEMLLELNMASDAQLLAGRAAVAFSRLNMPYEYAKALVFGGLARFRRGDSPLALRMLRQARAAFKKEGNRYWPAAVDLYQAIVLEFDGRWNDAARLAQRAAKSLRPHSLTGKFALCNLLLAKLELRENRPASARALLDEAAASELSPALKCHLLYLGGIASERLNDMSKAELCYSQALAGMELARNEFWNRELRISYLQDKASLYQAFAALALKSGGAQGEINAFNLVQRAKSRTLLESLDAPRTEFDGSDERAEELLEATRNLNAGYRQLDAVASRPAELKSIRARIQDLERNLARLRGEDSPEGLLRGDLKIESPEVIANALPPDATLVEYFIIQNQIHVWLLTAGGVSHYVCGAAQPARYALQLLQFQLAKFTLGPSYLSRFEAPIQHAVKTHLRELYSLLIAPIRNSLATESLIFAPVGFLHHVPFNGLLDANGRSLVDVFTISIIPSASVYLQCARRQSEPAAGSLVLAAGDLSTPHVAREGAAVAAILPDSELLIGEEATADALLQKAVRRKYIHIAAHGLERRDNPLFSAIGLGNSQVRSLDLDRLRLSADLVTLSGCSTGVSVVTGADELVGLMRGMLGAGAKSLLAALWDVSDDATATFMTAFYGHLFGPAQRSPARALRAAMLESRATHENLYFWGAFQVVGVG
jgi:CHAT domain-containing protein/tetratricopeptide (TPR) repeat protein